MIDVEQRSAVTVLRLAHGKANALDVELCDGLTAQLETLRTSATSGAVVLVGTGSIFSAGVDLRRVLDGGVAYLYAFLPALTRLFDTVYFHPKPVVAAVNGHAIAGGCVLACAADRRLMARDGGRIGVPELLVGVPFPTVALEIMRGTLAPQHLQQLVFDGATLTPADAQAIGLVDELVDAPTLLERAVAAAEALLAVPAAAFELTKRQLRQPVQDRLQVTRADLDRVVDAIWRSVDTRAAIRRYVDRTLTKR